MERNLSLPWLGGVMPRDLRAHVRHHISRFPWLVDVKSRLHYGALRAMRRPFEADFHALRPFLQRDTVCLDVGANHGQSIDALRMMEPGVRVIAFEPYPLLYTRLWDRFQKKDVGGDRTRILPYGVSDHHHVATLFIPYYRGFRYDGLATTVSAEAAAEWFSYSMWNYDPDRLSVREHRVQMTTLDDTVTMPVGLIKVDVQGGELAALRGAVHILTTDQPVLMVEQSGPCELDEFLMPLDYEPYRWSNGVLERGFGSLNTIYLPPQVTR